MLYWSAITEFNSKRPTIDMSYSFDACEIHTVWLIPLIVTTKRMRLMLFEICSPLFRLQTMGPLKVSLWMAKSGLDGRKPYTETRKELCIPTIHLSLHLMMALLLFALMFNNMVSPIALFLEREDTKLDSHNKNTMLIGNRITGGIQWRTLQEERNNVERWH